MNLCLLIDIFQENQIVMGLFMLQKTAGMTFVTHQSPFFFTREFMGFYTMINLFVIYNAFYLDVAQNRTIGAPSETRNHSWRLVSLAC